MSRSLDLDLHTSLHPSFARPTHKKKKLQRVGHHLSFESICVCSGAGAGPAGPAAAVPIFSLKKKKKKDVCLIGRVFVVFAGLVERGLFVMEDPEH